MKDEKKAFIHPSSFTSAFILLWSLSDPFRSQKTLNLTVGK